MEISDEIKKYLIIFGALIAIVYFIYEASTDNFSCDAWADDFRKNAKFNLVLTKKENNDSRDAYLYGIDLKNKLPIKFYDGGGWIARNFEKFEIGDTLIKGIGKYTIVIKRNGKTILIPFECSGKIYSDK